ncbi:hypothetical protein ACFO8Q_04750 [Effusibacillus consociatus]|uniref:Uncharacterized protein n=1 Tax=Effusibacillus consociatus TaxID=1117041 RepID=A0ABV9Q045_9BACL
MGSLPIVSIKLAKARSVEQKEEQNQITRFEFWSNTDQNTLESIAKVYLQVPVK